MKLSVTMMSFNDYVNSERLSAAQFIDICSKHNVDAVDILEYFWIDKEKEIKEIPKILKEKNLDLGAFCIGNNFIVPPEERAKQVESVKEGIDTAVKLGTSRLRVFGGSTNIPQGIRKEDRLDIIIECFGKCIDYAKDRNITMVLENHGGVPVTSDELLKVIHSIDSPYLKVNFDIGNFLSSGGENPINAAEKLYPFVDFVHAKDLAEVNSGDKKYEACVTGEGIVPIKECLQLLKQKGYDGYVSLEYEAWSQQESMEGVKRSLNYLKKVLEEI